MSTTMQNETTMAESTVVQMDETQAARFLGVSVHKLRQDRFYGRGAPYFKLGRAVRYQQRDLVDYLASCRVVPAGRQGGDQ